MVRYHRKSSKKKYFVLLFFIAITMGVGYAYLSSTLKIQSNTVVKSVKFSFTNDSWETIVSGEFGTHTLRLANTSTPSECSTEGFSQTACGFVVEFADIIEIHKMNSTATNVGGWPGSELYTYVQNDIYNALPNDLKEYIVETYTVSGYGLSETSNFSSNDKIYLFSSREVFGDKTTSSADFSLTRQLDYYENLNVDVGSNEVTKKKYNGENHWWWLRSANKSGTNSFYDVSSGGYWNSSISSDNDGLSPAFRLA